MSIARQMMRREKRAPRKDAPPKALFLGNGTIAEHEMRLIRDAVAHLRAARYEEALPVARSILRVNGASLWGASLVADALAILGRRREARHLYELATRCPPRTTVERRRRADAWRQLGEIGRACEDDEARWDVVALRNGMLRGAQPYWRGTPLRGRTLLVESTDGFGDCIETARYLPELRRFGGRVVAEMPRPLMRIMRHSQLGAELIEKGEPAKFDEHITSGSLAYALRVEAETMPGGAGYLAPPDSPSEYVRNAPPRRVGIAWAGNPTHRRDNERSMSAEGVRRLMEVTPNIEWVSVMHPSHPRASDPTRDPALSRIRQPEAPLGDYFDTAALLSRLDMLVTVDTSVCHLAGALGVPVLTMLSSCPNDHRWFLEGDTTPLYASMRLVRLRGPNQWMELAERVAVEMTPRATTAARQP